jgi:hypothetical protein
MREEGRFFWLKLTESEVGERGREIFYHLVKFFACGETSEGFGKIDEEFVGFITKCETN